jgi:hypothetical protein
MIRPTAVVLAAALAFAFATAAADAGRDGIQDYASRWPVVADGDGAYAVTLTPEVYAQLHRPDLSDLAAFDADGKPLAFGPLPASLVRPAPRWRDARWFALPVAGSGAAKDLHIHATRDAAGALSFDATVVGEQTDKEHPDLLIDVQPGAEAIDQIDLEFAPGDTPIDARMVVEASDDLQRWHTLLDTATVARLQQGGEVLERRLVELPPTNAAYLRLRPLGETTALPLASVRVRLQPAAPERRLPPMQWRKAIFVRREGAASFVYELPARVPAELLDIQLGDDNAIDRFDVSSREGPTEGRREFWNPRGSVTVFRLRGGGVSLDNAPLSFSPTRDREWKLDAGTALAQAPVVKFGYHPETWLLLTHGKAPASIVAGSARAKRPDFPLDALYGQVKARYGGDWEPPAATLGPMAVAGGPAARIETVTPDEKRQWVLWGVLILGVVVIIGMVLKLMREGPAPPSGP